MSYKHETKLRVQSELARRGWSKAAQVIIEFFDALENSDEYKATQARIADLHAQVAAFKKYKMERECFTIDDWRIRAMNLEQSWSDCSRCCAVIQAERDNARAKLADCQAVIRDRGHEADCPANWCYKPLPFVDQCGYRQESHGDLPRVDHEFQPGPCSDACGHDRTTGEKA